MFSPLNSKQRIFHADWRALKYTFISCIQGWWYCTKKIDFLSLYMAFSCNSIHGIDCRWRKETDRHCTTRARQTCLFYFLCSLAFPIEGWLNEQEEILHDALFRRPLFLSVWGSLLAQQAGHSIRCFESACSIVSLHFLFCFPAFPKALVALISRGPSAL